MDIHPAASRPSLKANPAYFAGEVWQDVLIETQAPARLRAIRVTFMPGARTHWHTHPLGQTLHVLSGHGRLQLWGGEVQALNPGDTAWIAPGEKHWHGASPGHTMVHLAMQEALDGVQAVWMEPVTDPD